MITYLKINQQTADKKLTIPGEQKKGMKGNMTSLKCPPYRLVQSETSCTASCLVMFIKIATQPNIDQSRTCSHSVMTSPFCPIIPSRLVNKTKNLENTETIGGFERSTRQDQKTDQSRMSPLLMRTGMKSHSQQS